MKRDVVDHLELLVLTYKQLEVTLANIRDYLYVQSNTVQDARLQKDTLMLYQAAAALGVTLDPDLWADFAAYVAGVVAKIDTTLADKLIQRSEMTGSERFDDLVNKFSTAETADASGDATQGDTDKGGSSGGGTTGSNTPITLN